MDPLAALHEIAFRMERDRQPSFKIKAFRTAAAVLAGMDADEVRARADDGRLQKAKGVGSSTFAVVREALDGAVPERLAALREHADAERSDAGRDLLGRLRGDLHTHTDWSDGTTSIADMVAGARMLGREYLAVTDHSPHLTVAHGLTAERLAEQLDAVAEADAASPDVRVLSGIEVDVLDSPGDGRALDQSDDLLDRLDVVVASLHSKLRAPSREITARLLAAIADPRTTVLGHVTGRLIEGSRGTRPPSEFDAEAVFAAAAEAGVAIEINARPEREDPPDELIALALDAGCLFSIDSDAHAPGHLDFLGLGAERAARAGVPVERIITSWPVDRMLEHASSRR